MCIGQLQALKSEGLRPATMREIMEQVVHWVDCQRWDFLSHWQGSVDTGDSVLYKPGLGRSAPMIKVVSQSPSLSRVDYGAALKPDYVQQWAGSLVLRHSVYEEAGGEEFSLDDVERYANTPLTRSDAEANPLWLALAGGDSNLLRAYAKVLDALFGDSGMMRFSVFTGGPHATLVERLVCFTGLNAKSNVSARNLGSLSGAGRFVGLPIDLEAFLAQQSGEGVDTDEGADAATAASQAGGKARVNQDLKKVA